MKTKQVPRSDWGKFFDNFSRHHEGSLATLEIFATEIGAQVEERELAFEGIVFESNEVSGNQIMIMLGVKADDHITHSVTRPISVSLEQTDDGADVALAIGSEDGTTALLRFRSPTLPESVDEMVSPIFRTVPRW